MTLFTADVGVRNNSFAPSRPRLVWRRTFADGTTTDFMTCNPNGAGDARVSRVASGGQMGQWLWRASAARKIADGIAPCARSAAVAAENAMGRNTLGAASLGETGDGDPQLPRPPRL